MSKYGISHHLVYIFLTSFMPNTTSKDMTPTLTTVPLEILLEISTYLAPSSILALRRTSRVLRSSVPTPNGRVQIRRSICEYIAWRRVQEEQSLRKLGKRRCVICGASQALHSFRGHSPICKWHDGWRMAPTIPKSLEPWINDILEDHARSYPPFWVALRRTYCMHCREILGWHIRECRCSCDTCGRLEVECFVRISDADDHPNSWALSDVDESAMTVVEQHLPDVKSLEHVGQKAGYYRPPPRCPIIVERTVVELECLFEDHAPGSGEAITS
jgi:hypothetical protein